MYLINKTKEENKGITLIALIITVIVILILAGTMVTMLLGNRNVLDDAVITREIWDNKVKKSETEFDKLNNLLEQYMHE